MEKTSCLTLWKETHKAPTDSAVYEFIVEKENEGKPKRVAKIAGLNKFLRIYYARGTVKLK